MSACFLDILHRPAPGRPALAIDGDTITYAALADAVERFAALLRAQGVGRGARVLVCLPNGPQAIVALLGTIAANATGVPVDAGDAIQIDDFMRIAGATHRVETDASGALVVRAHAGLDPGEPAADAIALIRFSSGYSGRPKGICLTQPQMLHMAQTLRSAARLDGDHRELVITPVAYSGAWQRVAATLAAGGCIAFAQPGALTVRGLLEDIQASRATGFFATPSLLRILLAAPAAQVASGLAGCRSVEFGSASLAAAELQAFLDLCHARVLVHYGLSECSRATLLDARAHPDKLHTVGRAAPGVQIAFADGGGLPSPHLREGEILLRAPHLTTGYWRADRLNAERFVDGWLRTRDLGAMDDDGFVVHHGRTDDVINCGGRSLYPAESERLLGRIEGVREYVIAGVDDPRGLYGQVPWAFVQPVDATGYQASAFMRVARQRLPAVRRPRRVVLVDELPRTRSGKVDRLRTARLHGPNPNNGA